jgi:hypothetical protein
MRPCLVPLGWLEFAVCSGDSKVAHADCSKILCLVLLLICGCDNSMSARANRGDQNKAASDGSPTSLTDSRPADIGILFVGNSHTSMHDLPGIVCDMIRFANPGKSVASQQLPVSFLEDLERDSTWRKEIESGAWKYVILQAQKISMSGRANYPRQQGIDIARFAKERGLTVIFYPEWGLKGVAGDGPRQERVYREMASAAGVGVAPVAVAWDLALAEHPDLPLHSADGNHQSPVGAFLTAAVLCGAITHVDPKKLAAFSYAPADEQTRAFLASAAARALAAESK